MSSRLRKILAVTGNRAEYDIIYPVLDALRSKSEVVLKVCVTGSHLSPFHGHTVDEIRKDDFDLVLIESLLAGNAPSSRVKSAAVQLSGLVEVIENFKPDILYVEGDREEAITTALAGAYMGVAVAHSGGGDVALDGNIDNSVRYATSKLAHLHFPVLEEHAEVLRRLGEDDWRIHVVGNPGLDRFLTVPQLSRVELSSQMGLDLTSGHLIVVIYHPILSDLDAGIRETSAILEAVSVLDALVLVSLPNSDAGGFGIRQIIECYAAQCSNIHAYSNLPRLVFVNLMRTADLLVGNSSAGIFEAPLLRLPVVNVGSRQRGRPHSDNVIFVDGQKDKIAQAIRFALTDPSFEGKVANCRNPYGDGHAGEKVADILASIELNERLIFKSISYDVFQAREL